jgi:hypothetical protein
MVTMRKYLFQSIRYLILSPHEKRSTDQRATKAHCFHRPRRVAAESRRLLLGGARPALDSIQTLDTPVLCTSKTRPEVELIQKEIGLSCPFIVENGGGIFFPQEYEICLSAGPLSWTPTDASPWVLPMPGSGIHEKRHRVLISFGDMSVERYPAHRPRRPQAALARDASSPNPSCSRVRRASRDRTPRTPQGTHDNPAADSTTAWATATTGRLRDTGDGDLCAALKEDRLHRLRGQPNDFPPEGRDIPVLIPMRRFVRGHRTAGLVRAPYPAAGVNAPPCQSSPERRIITGQPFLKTRKEGQT